MKIAKKTAFYLGGALLILFLFYQIWTNTNLGSSQKQSFKIDITESYGDSVSRANLIGVQAYMEPADYASEENFKRKTRYYLEEAKRKNWLIPNKTIIVFPEYYGTWLVALNEKESVYTSPEIEAGMQTMVLSNIGKFFKTYMSAPNETKDKIKHAVFAMKASVMAIAYQNTFAQLAKEYQVTIVAGSILLPAPKVENGNLTTSKGQLFNISVVFGADGNMKENLIKKAFPTADELNFVCPVKPEDIPVFETSVGRMAVLICADAWFSAAYKPLKEKGVDFIITPSYSNGFGLWNKPWSGYSGAETPKEAQKDVGNISLGEAWVKYAMGTRAKQEGGVKKGLNVFLQGYLWDLGADGSTIILNDSAIATRYIGKAALINLWL